MVQILEWVRVREDTGRQEKLVKIHEELQWMSM